MSAYHKLAASSHALCIPAYGLEEAFQKKGSASARHLATYERLTSVSLDKAHRRILILPRGIARDFGLTALNRTYSPEIDEKQVESFLEPQSHRETMLISSTLTMAANRPSNLYVQLPVHSSGCSSGCKYRGTAHHITTAALEDGAVDWRRTILAVASPLLWPSTLSV